MRRFLVATVCCGVVISGCAIASAIVLAHHRRRRHHRPGHPPRWATGRGPLLILLALWTVRAAAHWLQARLGQRGASATIADLSGAGAASVTAAEPRELAQRRDDAATVVVRGLDGLRPYFTAYLPALFLAAILTPAAVAVIAWLRPAGGR